VSDPPNKVSVWDRMANRCRKTLRLVNNRS
jgi:hypothetical protein